MKMIIKKHKPISKWKTNLVIIIVAICLIFFGYVSEFLFYPNHLVCRWRNIFGATTKDPFFECSNAISILFTIGVSLLAFVYIGHEVIKWRRKPLDKYWDVL